MNPSARPWYPSDAVSNEDAGVPATTVRRQNNPYQFSTVCRPPTPLCADVDLEAMRLDALLTPVAALRRPYRSAALSEPAARPSPPPPPAPIAHGWGAVSGAEPLADAAPTEETYCNIARAAAGRVSIPLPRSLRKAGPQPAPPAAASVPSAPHTAEAATSTTRTTPTTRRDTDHSNEAGASSDPPSTAVVRSPSSSPSTSPSSSPFLSPLPIASTPTASTVPVRSHAAKKAKTRPKREEKWTIVRGKPGEAAAAVAAATAAATAAVAAAAAAARRNVSNASGVKGVSAGTTTRLPTSSSPSSPSSSAGNSKSKQQQQQQQQQQQSSSSSQQQQQQPQRERDESLLMEDNSRGEGRVRRRRVKSRSSSSTEDALLDRLATHGERDNSNILGNTNDNNSNHIYGNSNAGGGNSTNTISTNNTATNSSGLGGTDTSFVVMGVPLACVTLGEQLLPPAPVPTRFRQAFRVLQRSLALSETSTAKMLLLQRALQSLPESSYPQCPALICAILLETSDSCVDVEKSLQTCYKALQLAERHGMDVFEMLARLAITRTFARVIDTVDARTNLTRAATIAIAQKEKAALGWIAMQMGVTLELSGSFPESLAWYAAAESLARATRQHQLLCDIQCCQSIAYSAVGETAKAQEAYEASRELLSVIPRHRHQRPLQNYAQLKSQLGDMSAALKLQEAELEIAKEMGDSHAAARCMGAIALTKRFQARYDEAAEDYMEELCVHNSHDPRQAVESLTGAAACWRMGGHLQKAYDYCMRALRQAQQCQDLTTLAKALVELAEAELGLDRLDASQGHLREALAAIARVDEAEQKQYLVKAALCEVEWRCCGILEQLHIRRGEALLALQYADRCHVPNTTHVARLLRRRRRRRRRRPSCGDASNGEGGGNGGGGSSSRNPNSGGNDTSGTVGGAGVEGEDDSLASRASLGRLFRLPVMKNWRVACYSLPWNEGLDFTAYILSDANATPTHAEKEDAPRTEHVHTDAMGEHEDSKTSSRNSNMDNTESNNNSSGLENGENVVCTARPLRLSEELLALICGPNALTRLFDVELHTERGERIYGDTPLWPQHYSKVAFDFHKLPENAARVAAMANDALYCLRLLYDAFVRPIESDLSGAEGVMFVGDGIFTRLPFHAFHDGEQYLAERFLTSTCCSMALLCTLADAEPAEACVSHPDANCTVITDKSAAAGLLDASLDAHGTSVRRVTIDEDEDEDDTPEAEEERTEDNDEDAEMRRARRLLRRLQRRVCARRTRNALFRALHESPGGVLDLRLRALPEVKEDFCGALIAAPRRPAAHAAEIANTWDLRRFALLLCGGVGTYGGVSIHETGVPVYRALQYAGARRVLLSVGSRLSTWERPAQCAFDAAVNGRRIAHAVNSAYREGIGSGEGMERWASLTLTGLP